MAVAVYDGSPGYMKIETFTGNFDSLLFTFPFDISSGYDFFFTVYDAADKELFTNTGVISGLYDVTYEVSAVQNLTIGRDATYVAHWLNGPTAPRAFAFGPFVVGFP